MMKSIYVAAAAAVLALAACNNNPTEGAAKAKTAAPVELTKQAKSEKSETIAISAADGTIGFVGAKVTAKHGGSFEDFSGTLTLESGESVPSAVDVTIQMKSLKIEPEKLAGHLKTEDFFHVEKFPTARFVSTEIKAGAAGGATHTVTGNLTLHGVTKSITFPATLTKGANGPSIAAEFGINRKDFKIVYPGMPDDLIKDEVLIDLKLNPNRS